MNSLLGIFADAPAPARQPIVTPIREENQRKAVFPASSVHEEQIRSLVQQLFFRADSNPARCVAFVSVDASDEISPLCLEVARSLSSEDRYDVGLIDAHSDPSLLQSRLRIAPPSRPELTWPIAGRLWMVPRQSWQSDDMRQQVTEQDLARLRDLTTEFDCSVLWCGSVSWRTLSIGKLCDGAVLVLTANKTRRLVAAQVRHQLQDAQIPLLGTVLTERRFPVPKSLYRSL